MTFYQHVCSLTWPVYCAVRYSRVSFHWSQTVSVNRLGGDLSLCSVSHGAMSELHQRVYTTDCGKRAQRRPRRRLPSSAFTFCGRLELISFNCGLLFLLRQLPPFLSFSSTWTLCVETSRILSGERRTNRNAGRPPASSYPPLRRDFRKFHNKIKVEQSNATALLYRI